MGTFDFYKDEKVSYWERTGFTVKSDSYGGAAAIAGEFAANCLEETGTVSIEECTVSIETGQPVPVEHNRGAATAMVYDGNNRLIAANSGLANAAKHDGECKINTPKTEAE